ncbi:MAG: erythromycin esterase family protein [Janthinobacterium lividum]
MKIRSFLPGALFGAALLLGAPVVQAQTVSAESVFAGAPLETIQAESENFTLFDKAFYANQLFLLGEAHGVRGPQALDFALLKHLNARAGVRTYVAEVDCAKAYYLNEYLRTGQNSTLRLVFRSWVAGQAQWGNQEFYQKIQRIRALNQTLPAARRIGFVGFDELQDLPLAADYITVLLRTAPLAPGLRSRIDSVVTVLRLPGAPGLPGVARRAALALAGVGSRIAYDDLRHALANAAYDLRPGRREDNIFANFQALSQTKRLAHEKMYGMWGLGHVLQSPLQNGFSDLAARIRQSALPVHNKVVSVLCVFSGCQMLYPTAGLPGPWQAAGQPYTVTDKFNHDGPLVTITGLAALMQRTAPGSTTLVRLDAPGAAATRLPIQLHYAPGMPPEQQMQFRPELPATAYVQYLLLVRGSGPVTPLGAPGGSQALQK